MIQIQNDRTALPIGAYFDHEILSRELGSVFQTGCRYVGHKAMVPDPGCYATLAHEQHGRVLVRGHEDIRLLSNVCRHRQYRMLEGQGQAHGITCPLHHWTYGLDGQLKMAPYFDQSPCLDLESTPIVSWNGLLFENAQHITHDLQSVPFMEQLDFEGYVLNHSYETICEYNWKIFLEVYTDDYHVAPIHPGLSSYVDCAKLSSDWHLGRYFSVQRVGISDLSRPGTAVYARWQEHMRRINPEGVGPHGAIWMTIYPNVMIEWYPKCLVISTLWPNGPESTINRVDFYYPEDIALFEPDFVSAHQAAYNETAAEDDEIARRLAQGRRALWNQNKDETGPYQQPMEAGMRHLHQYLHEHVGYGDIISCLD